MSISPTPTFLSQQHNLHGSQFCPSVRCFREHPASGGTARTGATCSLYLVPLRIRHRNGGRKDTPICYARSCADSPWPTLGSKAYHPHRSDIAHPRGAFAGVRPQHGTSSIMFARLCPNSPTPTLHSQHHNLRGSQFCPSVRCFREHPASGGTAAAGVRTRLFASLDRSPIAQRQRLARRPTTPTEAILPVHAVHSKSSNALHYTVGMTFAQSMSISPTPTFHSIHHYLHVSQFCPSVRCFREHPASGGTAAAGARIRLLASLDHSPIAQRPRSTRSTKISTATSFARPCGVFASIQRAGTPQRRAQRAAFISCRL